MVKYQIGDEYFRFRCDASEWSFQLSRRHANTIGRDNLRILKWDDMSYGVYDPNEKVFIKVYEVIELTPLA